MLIAFESNAHTDVMMFADIAKSLIKMMGHSGTIPGAIAAKDIPAALTHLKKALEAESPDKFKNVDNEDEDEEFKVSMSSRAYPLIEMLKAAARDNEPIMWHEKK